MRRSSVHSASMSDDDRPVDRDDYAEQNDVGDRYVGAIEPDGLIEDDQLQPTPAQHERLKDLIHGDRFTELKRADRRYLVIGRGEGGPGERRRLVRDRLDDRPGAIGFQLEDFGFTGDELELWAPAFEILAEMASHVVGVLEDFDGGYVWEIGYLYHYQTRVRNILWLLKRVYDSGEEMRERYDNGMAASHLAALEAAAADRVIEWTEEGDLPEAVAAIP